MPKITRKMNITGRKQPREFDIMCGKDKTLSRHPGNQLFRKTVELAKDRYRTAADNATKSFIFREIIDHLQLENNCRFVKYNKETKSWIELDAAETRDKVGHALRFAVRGNNQKRYRRQKHRTMVKRASRHRQEQPRGQPLGSNQEVQSMQSKNQEVSPMRGKPFRVSSDFEACKVGTKRCKKELHEKPKFDGSEQVLPSVTTKNSESNKSQSEDDAIDNEWTLEDKCRFYHVFQRQQEILEDLEDDDWEYCDPLGSSEQSECSHATNNTSEDSSSLQLLELDCSPEPLYHFSVHDLADFLPEILELPTVLDDGAKH